MSNPIEVLNREIEEEKLRSALVKGDLITEVCKSLLHPNKRNRGGILSNDHLAELMGLVGTKRAIRRTVTYWENDDRVIPPDQQVLLHRMYQVLTALPEDTKPRDRYIFLTAPQSRLLKGQQVSPIELLRMQSPAGFRTVMSSLPKNPER